MRPKLRTAANILGLVIFVGVVGIALHRSPPQLAKLDFGWLVLAIVSSLAAVLLQSAQTAVFLAHEKSTPNWVWPIWFTAEKAWINTIVPAKIGTASALVLLQQKLGIRWERYTRFMLFCGGLTAACSLAGLTVLVRPGIAMLAASTALYMSATFALRMIYRMSVTHTALLSAIALLNLAALTFGVGSCVLGLGYHAPAFGIAAIGIALNTLSIVAVTPGNFGFRESILAALSPILPLDFSVVIQASACFVVVRLLVSLSMASALRSHALR